MKTCNELNIGEVAQLTGVPASTLRYYEEKSLIKSVGRDGLKRVFSSSVVDQLALICLGREAGFSLDDIRDMFSVEGGPSINRAQLLERAEELERTIQQLTVLRESIIHVANCPEPNQLECPRFQTLVRSAARKQKRAEPKKQRKSKSV